jgi:hypothetical protein
MKDCVSMRKRLSARAAERVVHRNVVNSTFCEWWSPTCSGLTFLIPKTLTFLSLPIIGGAICLVLLLVMTNLVQKAGGASWSSLIDSCTLL